MNNNGTTDVHQHQSNSNPVTCEPVQLTDTGNAELFAFVNVDKIRYSHTSRKWLIWDGARWERDQTSAIQRMAKETLKRLWLHAGTIADEDRKLRIGKHALKSQYKGRIEAMVGLTQSERGIAVTDMELDSDPWLLNVKNGTLNLKTGTLHPHRREDLITKIIPVNFDPTAKCPIWDGFLNEVMLGDVQQIRFVQKAIGYSLTGITSEQVIFILLGPGANGKSTLIRMIHLLLCDYALATSVDTFLKKGSGINNDVARLKGARFVSAVEPENGRHLAEALVKQLTGEDKITARFLYAEWFDYDPTAKLFLAVNHKPKITGSDHAIWRRIRLIPFNYPIPPEKRDKEIVSKLSAELPGILRWAVEGCLLWQREGLEPPPTVKAATDDYRAEMDVLGDFIAECCETDPSAKTPFKDIYNKYRLWSIANNEDHLDQKELARGLSERGFTMGRTGTLGRFRSGIRLKWGDTT
jgi:putative DNA primase/helicase